MAAKTDLSESSFKTFVVSWLMYTKTKPVRNIHDGAVNQIVDDCINMNNRQG